MRTFVKINKLHNNFAETAGLGGISKDYLIMPYGLYANPAGEQGISTGVHNSNNLDTISPIMQHIDLPAGDVILTNKKVKITLQGNTVLVEGQDVKVIGNNVQVNAQDVTVTASNITLQGNVTVQGNLSIQGASVTHAGLDIGNTHKHIDTGGYTSVGVL